MLVTSQMVCHRDMEKSTIKASFNMKANLRTVNTMEKGLIPPEMEQYI
jgi:hypothetical protein